MNWQNCLSFFVLATLACVTLGYQQIDQGNGFLYKLSATKDTFTERNGQVFDRHSIGQLLIGRHPGFPVKRILIQFENLPLARCPLNKIKWARIYLNLARVHRASFNTKKAVPWLDQKVNVHLIKRSWEERSASATQRCQSCSGPNWYRPGLDLGRDAVSQEQCDPTLMRSMSPFGSFYSFDITGAMKAWAEGAPNYGVMMKMANDDVNAVDWRFWDRHQKNKAVHPYVMVQCSL